MLTSLIEFLSSLPTFAFVIIAIVIVGILFSIFKRLIRFAMSLAALTILILVIIKLLEK
ncbi:MAG TPA: hypothetical protein VEC36_05085 [Patescibacteria group bacterium]|nr:hypothetical protein [Patescibacteria group bacterium]